MATIAEIPEAGRWVIPALIDGKGIGPSNVCCVERTATIMPEEIGVTPPASRSDR